MAASTLKNINIEEIDDHTKSLLDGFVRDVEKSMSHIIPDSIVLIILSFYYISEYFKQFDDKLYEITNNNKTIKRYDGTSSNGSIYANFIISPHQNIKQCVWKFKINKKGSNYIYIGICATSSTHARDIFYYCEYGYCLQLDGYKWHYDDPNPYCTEEKFKSGDIVSMILNVQTKTLEYAKNEKNLGTALHVDFTDLEYRMAVMMDVQGDEIELIDFKCEYVR